MARSAYVVDSDVAARADVANSDMALMLTWRMTWMLLQVMTCQVMWR